MTVPEPAAHPRRLVIDDLRVFTFEAEYARTSTAGLERLADGPWDEVWFDHDLGGEDTIRPVVMHIVEACHFGNAPRIGQCVVHTDNVGAKEWVASQLGVYLPVVTVRAIGFLESILPH